MTLSPKEIDRIKAKERMRKLRGSRGTTPNDRARNYATEELIRLHKGEFNEKYREFLKREWEEELSE